MSLHRLTKVVVGVPNVSDTLGYYTEFGLAPLADGRFATSDGGEQLQIVEARSRRLLELGVGADDLDDLAHVTSRLQALGLTGSRGNKDTEVVTYEPVAGYTVRVAVAPRITQQPSPLTPYNGPGRVVRQGRSPAILREEPVRPRKLGHVVVGSTDLEVTVRFFVEGLGFSISDFIGDKGAFMRCSDDHHNLLALAAPVNFLHHTSWQVNDIDDVGRGAMAMLDGNPDRHVWGLGRHHAGANFFWYLKDPAGNFSEYYSDMDCVPNDELWTPEVLEGARGLFSWGPPPPPSFLAPEDLAELMAGAHRPG